MNSYKYLLISFIAGILAIYLSHPVHLTRVRNHNETLAAFGDMPTPLLRASALEFHGILSDYLLLKTMSFLGMKIQEQGKLSDIEWQSMASMLNASSDLDPRFWDPYLLAEMTFTWQAGMVELANSLLKKAAKNLPKDYRPPYFLGFNAFYFEHNAHKAAPYLRRAASLPGAPDFLKGLAARFSLYGNQTKLGIVFLAKLLRNCTNDTTKKYLTKRLELLKTISFLENRVVKFKDKMGRFPTSIQELISMGFIHSVPIDPYGGNFVILKNGRVYTTSNMIDKNNNK